jgi:hypothetical protein
MQSVILPISDARYISSIVVNIIFVIIITTRHITHCGVIRRIAGGKEKKPKRTGAGKEASKCAISSDGGMRGAYAMDRGSIDCQFLENSYEHCSVSKAKGKELDVMHGRLWCHSC